MSLRHIVNPVSATSFFDDYFETKPLILSRDLPNHFEGLLDLDDIDRIIATSDNYYPNVSLVNAQRKINAEEYVRQGNLVDVIQLFRLHADGATIILNRLNALHPTLTELCAELELELGCAVQANVYVTPPDAKGFKAHFDTHDVFVLQLHGAKQWRLYGTPIVLPLASQEDDASQDQPGVSSQEFVLNAGDTLYIPRGLVHDAVSLRETSVHVTVGAPAYTWVDLLHETLATASLNDQEFRKSLPRHFGQLGQGRAEARQMFRALIERLLAGNEFDVSLDAFAMDFVDRRRTNLRGQITQLKALDGLSLNSVVTHRPHLSFLVSEEPSTVVVRCHGNDIAIPRSASKAVHYALSTPRFEVNELPNELDDVSKLVLVRRLVREGILVVA